MRAKQALIVAAGVVVALVMAGLGLWQMQVFEDQGSSGAEERARLQPIPLLSEVRENNEVGDVYGRPVTASGTYLPEQQVIVRGQSGEARVLAALQLADGRVLPVIIGRAPADPPVARGSATVTGVFLASEALPDSPASLRPGELSAVRLPELAQRWPQQLLPGYVTLTEQGAAAHGLQPAELNLPSQDGSARNSGYAIQWWVFAAFAVGVSIKIARDLGKPKKSKPKSSLQEERVGD